MVAVIVAIELLLFTNVSHCANAKSYVLHWNTTNPLWVIFFDLLPVYLHRGESNDLESVSFFIILTEKSFKVS